MLRATACLRLLRERARASGPDHFVGFGGGMKMPNASGALPTVIVEDSAVFVAVSMIDTVPSTVPLPLVCDINLAAVRRDGDALGIGADSD
jgi:hypothetical protein